MHTQKWALSLSNYGYNVILFSILKPNFENIKTYNENNIVVYNYKKNLKVKNFREPSISKIIYLLCVPYIKKIIKKENPDILHAHYASSYGLIAMLIKFKPSIISVWGTDLYIFPKKNRLYNFLMKKIIEFGDKVCSTSNGMKKILKKDYQRDDVEVVPFGVDTNFFYKSPYMKTDFTVGTIKSIESHNGIECMIDAAQIIVNEYGISKIKFLIIGDGLLLDDMKKKTKKLKLESYVNFEGEVPSKKVVEFLNKLSVFVAVSTRESFGVSVLEASACEIPCITSDVGGLPEVNKNNQSGYLIPAQNPKLLAEKILVFYKNRELASKMGQKGRKRVLKNFSLQSSIKKMVKVYEDALSSL